MISSLCSDKYTSVCFLRPCSSLAESKWNVIMDVFLFQQQLLTEMMVHTYIVGLPVVVVVVRVVVVVWWLLALSSFLLMLLYLRHAMLWYLKNNLMVNSTKTSALVYNIFFTRQTNYDFLKPKANFCKLFANIQRNTYIHGAGNLTSQSWTWIYRV